MAKLPVYTQQGQITTQAPGVIRDINAYSGAAVALGQTAEKLRALDERWQNIKDTAETLDGKNKLVQGMTQILSEAQDYNDYKTPADLNKKQAELSQRLNQLSGSITSGFSNKMNARNFDSTAQLAVMTNQEKLKGIFRDKTIDMWKSNALVSQDTNMNAFIKSGNEGYKKSYFEDLDNGVASGFITREEATALKLKTDDWNFDYAYGQLSQNPYAKIPDNIMAGIDSRKQVQLRNFARTERKRLQAEALQNAMLDYYNNPTQENLNRVYKLNPRARGNKKLASIAQSEPNYETVSTYDGYVDALNDIKALADMNDDSIQQKQAILEKSTDIIRKIQLSNNAQNGDATLSKADMDKLYQAVYRTVNDKTIKNTLKDMPSFTLKKMEQDVNATKDPTGFAGIAKMGSYAARSAVAQNDIRQIGLSTAQGVMNALVQGDKQSAYEIYNQGLQAAIKKKYWYIPELQNQKLEAGKTKFNVNGKVYTFQGFSNRDIIVGQ